ADGWTTITADFALPPNAYFDYVNPEASGIFVYANPTNSVEKFIYEVDDAKVEVYDFVDKTLGLECGNGTNYDIEKGNTDNFSTTDASLEVVPAAQNGGNGNYALKVSQTALDGKVQWYGHASWGDIMGNGKYDVSMNIKLLPKNGTPTTGKFTLSSFVFPEQSFTLSSDKGMQKIRFQVNSNNYGSHILMGFKGNSEMLDFIVDDISVSSLKTPKLIYSDPVDGSISKIDNFMKLKVDNILRPQLITPTQIQVNGSSENVKSVKLQNDGSYLIEFKQPLAGGMDYTLGFFEATDMYGRKISPSISFKTKDAVYKPMLESTSPKNNSINVPINTKMTLKFDERLNFSTINTTNVIVNGKSENIKALHTDANKPQEFGIEFQNLLKGETYTVSLTGITHETENVPINDTKITFTVESSTIISGQINGDFEGTAVTTSNVNATTQLIDTDPADKERCGAKYLKVSQSAAWGSISYSGLNVEAGSLYKVSCDMKLLQKKNSGGNVDFTDIGGASSDKNAAYAVLSLDSNKKYKTLRRDDGFKTLTTYIAPGAFENLTFAMLGYENWGATMWYDYLIDNIVVEKVEPTKLLPTTYPKNNSENIPLNSTISLKFSDELKVDLAKENVEVLCNGVPSNAFTITKPTTAMHMFDIKLDDGLLGNSSYTIKIKNVKNVYDLAVANQEINFKTKPAYTIGKMGFYKNYGTPSSQEITKIETGEITAVIDNLVNNCVSKKNPVLVMSIYEGESMINTAIKTVEVDVNGETSTPVTVKLNVKQLLPDKKYSLKVILLEDLQTIRPIGNGIEIN
ncbi:MAG: Ig-like domain-containing protein, partial [Oscillospiraceae bacterium]